MQYANAAIAWGLQSYQFSRYKKSDIKIPKLVLHESADSATIENTVAAIHLVRDLINTPTENMGPAQLATATKNLSDEYGGSFNQTIGEQLLQDNFPAIHAVGRASVYEPRLLDLRWGDSSHPKLTLVGKGVCFDTGGLDLKPTAGMRLMKKDMGGAAHVLGLAKMIMAAKLPVQLRVLIPAVENSIAGNAYRPGDIISSRKGSTIEIGNTDAEGRVVLADALFEAIQEKPELIIDFATLTGAARVALGFDVAAMFTNDDDVATGLMAAANEQQDPMWRLPLHAGYRTLIDTPIADISNSGSSPQAGAITAALFLQHFVGDDIPWVHFDLMAWNTATRPGRPEGGEAMALRAVFAYLSDRFSD